MVSYLNLSRLKKNSEINNYLLYHHKQGDAEQKRKYLITMGSKY